MSLTGSASMTNELQGSVESGGTVTGKLAGLRFIQGLSAYEVAVVEGFSGTKEEWLASLKGKDGLVGSNGKDGVDGTSIQSIERTSGDGTPGTTDTYTVTLTDGSTTTFQIHNGADGSDGADGTVSFDELTDAQRESLKGEDGVSPTYSINQVEEGYRITLHDVNHSETILLRHGEDGAATVSVASIAQTSSSGASGAYNTITCTLTDGKTSTFRIRNGLQGADGATGATGDPGADATINGVNALTLVAESPLKLEQTDGTATLKIEGKVGGSTFYEATIGTSWTENEDTGVKSQTVAISGVTAANNAHVEPRYTGDGTSDGYAAFVTQKNQFFTCITNGYAETVADGITFYVFGDVPTVSIPIIVEVK